MSSNIDFSDQPLYSLYSNLPSSTPSQIKTNLALLPPDILNIIYSTATSIDSTLTPETVRAEVLKNPGLLKQAIKKVALQKLGNLTPEEKPEVYRAITAIAKQKADPMTWGREHAAEDISRLIRALYISNVYTPREDPFDTLPADVLSRVNDFLP